MKKKFVFDAIFLGSIALCVLAVVISYNSTAVAFDPTETTRETTSTTTTEETVEPMTEPTETEAPTTEATEPQETEATEPAQTEPPVILYDVPLAEDLQLYIIMQAERHGIDPAIIMAMCFRESSYIASAIGDGGNSYGLMQIQPRWNYDRMSELGCTDLLDPYQNVTVGIDLLADLVDRYDGDVSKALVAYNRGHYSGTITQYALNVLATAEELRVGT